MTENDDDDDSFGEFTFASSNITTTSNDDVWGDFNFNNKNNTITDQSETEPKWKKINGALPLSLFGVDDYDADVDINDVKPVKFGGKKEDKSKLEINDLLANLYEQKEEKKKNVEAVNSGNDLEIIAGGETNGSDEEEGGWEFIDASLGSKIAENDKVNKGSSEKSASPPGVQNGLREPLDLFAAVPSNGGFVGSHVMDNGFESKLTTSFQNGYMGEFKAGNEGTANDLSSNPLDGDDDFDDTFGDFETAVIEQPSEKKELSQDCNNPLSSPNASHNSVDLFAFSNGVSDGSHKENNGFDFSQSSTGQNGLASDPLSSHDVSHGSLDLFAFSNGVPDRSHKENNGFDFGQNSVCQNGVLSDPLSSHDASHGSVDLFAFSNGVSDRSHKEKNEFDFNQSTVSQSGVASDPLSSSNGSVDLFAFSNGVPDGSQKQNKGFDFSQISVGPTGVASDPFFQTEWKGTKDELGSQLPGGDDDDDDDDDDFGKFETAFAEAGSKQEETEATSKNYKEPVPLSIFGIEEEPETDNSLILQHDLFKSSSQGKHTRNQSSNLSINDILSDLYSQAEPVTSAYHEHNPDEKVSSLHSTSKEYTSHLGDGDDDDFDDGSWEFKDASIHARAGKQFLSFENKMSNCVDLYSKLKDELCVVARHQLHSLKKAQRAATQVGDEMNAASLNKEIQEALEKLHQKDVISTDFDSEDHSKDNISFKEYIESLLEPDYQVLESEYHISRRLSLVESDLQTVIDLINHFTTVLKMLTLAPKGEPADYVSIWFKLISVCSQELKHGTWIWKQSLQKNVHREILSEPQGKQYIIALGELYRMVVILGAAVKFYKPWILLGGADLGGVCGLLEECHFLWSTSGLEDVIPAESLLESIRNMRNLDENAIANVLSQEESQCALSLLSSGVVPEMNMVIWNGDKYFAAFANLWANLISPDPPKLSIHAG